jgi:hypothetical protein
MKGQMMLITAVVISLMMMATGSAISELGETDYNYKESGNMIDMIREEASKVDTRFRKDRENFRKMIGFLEAYRTRVEYSETMKCFNVSMNGQSSTLNLACIS